MNIIELLILNRLCTTPGGSSGCGCLFGTALTIFIIAVIGEIFSKIDNRLIVLLIILIVVLIFGFIISKIPVLSIAKSTTRREEMGLSEAEYERLKTLAENFVNKKKILNEDDYKKFYEIVKENNIEIPNNYSTDVPYYIRELLYSTALKNIDD